jgi:hypothetical protein
VSEWRRRWVITLRWDDPRNSPYGQDRRVFTVSAHQLGEMIRAARADPHIVAFPHEGKWETVGDGPQACPAGHPFGGGSFTRPRTAWYECPGCPGHHVYRCRHEGRDAGCPELLDPPPGPYCRPHPPIARQPTHHP